MPYWVIADKAPKTYHLDKDCSCLKIRRGAWPRHYDSPVKGVNDVRGMQVCGKCVIRHAREGFLYVPWRVEHREDKHDGITWRHYWAAVTDGLNPEINIVAHTTDQKGNVEQIVKHLVELHNNWLQLDKENK